MSIKNRITEKKPRTGALPSEQTAENAGKQENGSLGMMESDKLIYQLVENNVAYAGEQFGENLRFNSETLTNVLYDNIYKLLGEKFNEDEFVEWLAGELLEKGAITQNQSDAQQQTEPKVVTEIDDSAMQELTAKIDAAIKLIQANRITVFKILADIDNHISGLQQAVEPENQEDELRGRRDQQINGLIDKIQTNQETLDEHIQVHESVKEEIDKKVDEIQGILDKSIKQSNILSKQNKIYVDKIQKTIKKIGGNNPAQVKNPNQFTGNLYQLHKNPTLIQKVFGQSKTRTAKKDGKLPSFGKLNVSKLKKKPTLGQKIQKKLKSIKDKISKSFIGKTYRAVKKAVGLVAKVVKKVYSAVKKTVKAVYKTAKFAAKTFWGASKLVGKGIRAAGRGIAKGVKNIKKLIKQKKLLVAIRDFAPAQIVTKLGFRVIKFIGKQVWKGIKKLVFKAASFFKNLFRMGGKFINKVGMWVGKLGAGIVDKTYRFLVKPVASIMVTVFGFFTGVLMSPIQFMKWLVPSVFDRILSALSNIGQTIKNVLKSTWGIFRRILFNPITLTILIGGLFLFLGKWLFSKLSGGVDEIKGQIFPIITSVVSSIWSFIKGVVSIIWTVGKLLFKWIKKITDPDSWLVKTVTWVIKAFLAFKGWITDLMKATGKDSIDILCMFLAGDTIGVAIHMIAGLVIKLWNWIKNQKFFRIAFGLVKAVVKIYAMIYSIPLVLAESLLRAGAALGKWIISFGQWGSFGDIGEQFAKPWKEWWGGLTSIFEGTADDVQYEMNREVLTKDPTEDNKEKATRANIAVRSLKMKGTPEKNLALLDRLGGMNAAGNLRTRIEGMNKLYQANAEQVEQYSEFLAKTWEMGQGDSEMSQQVLRQLLESPELSQRLLSAFFYYNPQTGDTQMLRPAAYIGQFLENIRAMVANPDRDDEEAFKTLIEAFDQLNKERSHIINNQGDIIADFAEKIFKLNQNEKDDNKSGLNELKENVTKFNNGNLFDNISVGSSFEQIQRGDAKTQQIKSVTGDELGTNKLLQVKPLNGEKRASYTVKDFKAAPPPEPPQEEIGNVLLPPGSNPKPPPNPDLQADASGKNMLDKWKEHQATRAKMLQEAKMSSQAVNAAGYESLSFEEFKQRELKARPIPIEKLEAEKENHAKRLAALRTAKNVMAYHNQGKFANRDGFRIGKNASILKVPANGLSSVLYMFSPEWQRMQGAAKVSDDELLLELNQGDVEARERIRAKAREEAKRKRAEEAKRKREQEILDYSAKVSGGFIEVKIGEDVQAMREAYLMHMKKRGEIIKEKGSATADKMGLKNYSWDEFKRYYRRMHGLPEDGIKRIPFEGKKKERPIDWSTRYPMTADELGKYGIQMSEEGPVMIPLDKAMQAASSLLKGAKTIHSIRDGLEIMRQGLETETNKLKKQREDGIPTAVIQNQPQESESTQPVPSGESQPEYA